MSAVTIRDVARRAAVSVELPTGPARRLAIKGEGVGFFVMTAVAADIAELSAEAQAELAANLLVDMEARQVHPSIRKRLQTSGWQHPLVLPEMLRYFAQGSLGDNWDQPTPQQLLQVAAEMGDAG